jgi:ATP-binding cassette subfamily B protein
LLSGLLRTYLRPYRRELTAVILLQLVVAFAAMYLPTLNADIIDFGIITKNTGYIVSTGGWMLVVTVAQVACTIGTIYFGARCAMGLGRDLRSAVFHRIGEFSAREVARFGAPSLITRITNDVQQVQMLVMLICSILIAAPIVFVVGIVLALREDASLSWLLLACVPALMAVTGVIVTRMLPHYGRMQELIDQLNRILREQLSGIRVVRAFVRERAETRRFTEANSSLTRTAIQVGKLQALIQPGVMIVLNASSVAVVWFGAHRIGAGELQIGAMIAFLSYLVQILTSVLTASFVAAMIPRAAVCAGRITEVLAAEPSVCPPSAPVRELRAQAGVEFRAAEFRYPGAADPVLREVCFRVGPGRSTAIVGGTGAGKTTMLSLIPRLIDVTGGSVLVGGVDVRDLEPQLLRSRIGLVPQRPYLFTGTVASNLRYGNPDATDDELWQALDIAQARDFVAEMPDGLDAPITQGGTNVSGGQRQRLAIARALVRQPDIYLFDDAFSALDLATEARLRAALRSRTERSAVITVAQRVASILDADQIVVLDNGSVVGIGSHHELLAGCATYQEIVRSQPAPDQAA